MIFESAHYGTKPIDRIYLGSRLIWEANRIYISGKILARLLGVGWPESASGEAVQLAIPIRTTVSGEVTAEVVANPEATVLGVLTLSAAPEAADDAGIQMDAAGVFHAQAEPRQQDTESAQLSMSGVLVLSGAPDGMEVVPADGDVRIVGSAAAAPEATEPIPREMPASGCLSAILALPELREADRADMTAMAASGIIMELPEQVDPIPAALPLRCADTVLSGTPVALNQYTVTFVVDGKTVHTAAAIEGYGVDDPVTAGLVARPTKASTPQYDYEYADGWSLTEGGEVDADILSGITSDITVYAAFTASIRYYTVRFWDGETLVDTVSVPYGGTAETDYSKEGYKLLWVPSNENVTENRHCYAQWSENIEFSTATWAKIAELSESGRAREYFNVGDKKLVAMGGSNLMEIVIVGFDHDDLADGSGKAGITMMNTTFDTGALFRTSVSRTYTAEISSNEEARMPSELRSVLKSVTKFHQDGDISKSSSFGKTTAIESKVWVPSVTELGITAETYGVTHTSFSSTAFTKYITALGTPYELYQQTPSQTKIPIHGSEECYEWLTRTNYLASNYLTVANPTADKFTSAAYNGASRRYRIGFCV